TVLIIFIVHLRLIVDRFSQWPPNEYNEIGNKAPCSLGDLYKVIVSGLAQVQVLTPGDILPVKAINFLNLKE
ncbi:hypothetical protein, partial [Mixta calida]|uniref:hypothetical protein n=1 Tax=Mixta calida TaxID=665913 RepID=UPI0028A0AFFF